MNNTTINGALLKDMFLAGAALLEKNKAYIDSLNVFPVPDGDTGTNMSMTMQSAAREIKACPEGANVGKVAAAASLGALKGARGNSGVILSQIFRGMAKALDGKEEMDAELLVTALRMGTDAAYKAVMKPKEGTILTVSRMISTAVEGEFNQGANVFGLIDVMIESGEEALKLTPELLPVLKEAGVVDSGGKGLITIFRGFKMIMDGDTVEDYVEAEEAPAFDDDALTLEDINDIKFGYCTEFFVIHLVDSFSEDDLEKFRDKLMKIGDSVVVAHDSGFIKIHVHTNMPGKALQLALCLGEIDKVKIENMREQNREIQENIKKNEVENAMVAVSCGEGMDAEFTGLGVTGLISGGQTMNPSIDTIEKAIRKVNARNVFVLPNNPNIIMAAQQAAELSDRNVVVIPAPTGICLPLSDIERIVEGNPEGVVIIDEAYIDFGGESAMKLIPQYDNLLVVQTFSKSRSMAGARLGFGAGNRDLIQDLNTIKYSTNPYNVNRMTMAAGVGALEADGYFRVNCQKIMENRQWTTQKLESLGLAVIPSMTNFVFAKHPEIPGRDLYLALREKGILVRHFDKPRLHDYNRITIGSREQMKALVNALTEILEDSP